MFSKENELAAWKLISQACQEALDRYPNTLKEDIELLKKDDEEHNLGFNIRNCIMFRKGEKYIYHFFKDCALRVELLLSCNKYEAINYIREWKRDNCNVYFKNLLIKLIVEKDFDFGQIPVDQQDTAADLNVDSQNVSETNADE